MTPPTANIANDLGPTFEMRDDGSLFIPYGEFPHRLGRQLVDRTAAGRMAESLGGLAGKLLAVVGRPRRFPIYIGHPDVPGRGAEFPDKRAYGWGTAIEAENDGIRIPVKWTAEGERLIREGHFAFHSPYWEAEQNPATREVRPVRMISAGLTNNPNIPVPPLANDDSYPTDEPNEDDPMKKELADLLGKDENATTEDLLAEVARLKNAAEPAPDNEDDGGDDDEEEEEEEAASMAAENDRLLASIRAERVGMALDSLCLAGKLAVADRPAAAERLTACENDETFAAALDELGRGDAGLKTEGVTDGLAEDGKAVTAENDRAAMSERRRALLDAEMQRNGGNFNLAWQRLSRKEPGLFT